MSTERKNTSQDNIMLSDKRYLELKSKQNIIANWVKQIADKTGVKIHLEDLEKVV